MVDKMLQSFHDYEDLPSSTNQLYRSMIGCVHIKSSLKAG